MKKSKKILMSLFVAMTLVGCGGASGSGSSSTSIISSNSTSTSSSIDITDLSVRDATGYNGMVAAANPYAAMAGIKVLEQGGNAFDAAVAVSFALGVVEPYASGIGGGGIMVGFDAKNGNFVSYNFREFAPKAAQPSVYASETDLDDGVLSIGVPTQVTGLLGMLDDLGSKYVTRQQVMAPAIDYALNGVKITPELANNINDSYNKMSICPDETYEVFDDGLEPLKEGDTLIQKNYGKTLQKIADEGKDAFYTGEVAKAIIDQQKEKGGIITQEDLDYAKENYPIVETPVNGNYRGYDIVSATMPSSGGTILVETLNMLEHYGDIKSLGHNSSEYIHTVGTAMQLAYGDKRKYLGDKNFIDIPLSGLLSKQYAADRWDECYNPDSAFLGKSSNAYGGSTVDPYPSNVNPWDYCKKEDDKKPLVNPGDDEADLGEHWSTTAFSVCDKDGNIVSITQTINHFWGSSLIPAGCGFFLNNQLSSFTLTSSSASYVQPLKQPVSHIMPTIVLKDNEPWATLGSPGSTRIPSAVIQVLLNMIDFDMDIQSAINAARFFSYAISTADPKNSGGIMEYDDTMGANKKWIEIEGGIPESTCKELETKKYAVTHYASDINLYFGGVHGIRFDATTGLMHGGADPRRDGKAFGI